MPTLDPGVLALLAAVLEGSSDVAAARLEGDPPAVLPLAVRPAAARPAAEALLRGGRRALAALPEVLGAVVVPADAWRALDPAGLTLADVDTPADLDRVPRSADSPALGD